MERKEKRRNPSELRREKRKEREMREIEHSEEHQSS
jgi:hypothetical protein